MARNIQIREPGNNYADVLHPETNSGMVRMANGKTLQEDFDTHKTDIAAHNGFVGRYRNLPNFTDFNELTTPGVYHGVISGERLNEAVTTTATRRLALQVTVNFETQIYQELYYQDGGGAALRHRRFYRQRTNSTDWLPWFEIKTSRDIPRGVLTATLDTTWSGTSAPYTKTVTVNGIQSSDTPIIDVVMSGTYSTDVARTEAWGCIYRAVTANNSITFYAMEKPTVSLPIQIRVVR